MLKNKLFFFVAMIILSISLWSDIALSKAELAEIKREKTLVPIKYSKNIVHITGLKAYPKTDFYFVKRRQGKCNKIVTDSIVVEYSKWTSDIITPWYPKFVYEKHGRFGEYRIDTGVTDKDIAKQEPINFPVDSFRSDAFEQVDSYYKMTKTGVKSKPDSPQYSLFLYKIIYQNKYYQIIVTDNFKALPAYFSHLHIHPEKSLSSYQKAQKQRIYGVLDYAPTLKNHKVIMSDSQK